jgi:hypothetical protein
MAARHGGFTRAADDQNCFAVHYVAGFGLVIIAPPSWQLLIPRFSCGGHARVRASNLVPSESTFCSPSAGAKLRRL